MERLKRERFVSCVFMILMGYSIGLGQDSGSEVTVSSDSPSPSVEHSF